MPRQADTSYCSRKRLTSMWILWEENPNSLFGILLILPGVPSFPDVPDIRPYVDRAAVFAAPIWPDSGVRLKILEAFAMGKAVVATARPPRVSMWSMGRTY